MSSKKVAFSQIKLILKKGQLERSAEEIIHLQNYFSDNSFFQQHQKENGEKNLLNLFTTLKYENIKKDKFVMKYGEYGTTYYIVLKGLVEI